MNLYRVRTLLLAAASIAAAECQTAVDLRTQSKSVDFSAAASTKPMQTGAALPAACAAGQLFFLTTAPAGSNIYACNPANVWSLQGNLSVNPDTANKIVSSNGSAVQWMTLGGDISGAPNAVAVNKLQGRTVGSTAPSDGQVLKWNAAQNAWQPAPGQAGNYSYVFVSQTSLTIPGTVHQFGTASLIVDCYDSGTPPKRVEADSIRINPATYDVTINFSTAQTGYCVVNGAGTPGGGTGGGAITPVGGDLAGNTASATVSGLQNRPLAATAPSSGQALVWNGSTWAPATVSGGGGAVTSVFGRTGTVTAQTGDYSFAQISGSAAANQLPAAGGDLTGTLTAAQVQAIQGRSVANTAPSSGQALVWNGSSWAPATVSGGGGAVTSVFGRTGTVTAQTGDYSFAQISGSAAANQLPAAGGDLTGTLTAAQVQAIQGRSVAGTAPANGQALVWNGSSWAPSTITGGGGGASMAYQLQDFAVTWTSATVLAVGANCSPSAPCNVRFGNQTFNFTSSATATISGSGIGTAYFYVTSAGVLTVGHNLTVACSGCTQQSGVSSFPANVVPLWTWTANNGTWDSSGGRDQRAFLSSTTLTNGTGIILPGPNTIAVDTGVIPTYLMNSASLTFSSITSGTCAADQTLTVTGANPGDAVAPGWPVLPAGVLGMMFVSSTNNVAVRLCNFSGSTVSGSSLAYRATVVRNY
jgi:hypothetical protein